MLQSLFNVFDMFMISSILFNIVNWGGLVFGRINFCGVFACKWKVTKMQSFDHFFIVN